MKSWKTDLIFVSAVVAVVAVTGYLYYRDLTARVAQHLGKPIGTVVFKRNNAEQRFGNNVIWQEARTNTPVYSLEYLRTVADSAAVVHLEDGTQISLGANTLVQLSWNKKNRQINFLAGDLTANRVVAGHQAAGSNQVVINSQGSSVALQSANVSLSKNKGGLDVSVASGSVRLQTGASSQVVGTRDLASVGVGARSATVTKQHLFPSLPAADSIDIVHNGAANVAFKWTADVSANDYAVELSASRGFSKLERTVDTKTASAHVDLKPGVYYWRVSAVFAGIGKRQSPVRKLTVLNDPPITAISPDSGTVYSYRTLKPSIQYIWESSGIASAYRFQISSTRSFAHPLYSKTTTQTAVALNTLAAGTYYWRVLPVYNFGTNIASGASQESSFRVTRLVALTAPQPIGPADGTIANSVSVSANGLLFSWHPDSDISTYTLLLASDRSFAHLARQYRTSNNYLLMQRTLKPGTYYWKLEAQTPNGTQAPPSVVRSLRIRAGTASIALVTPAEGYAYSSSFISNAQFAWKSDIAGSFFVEVAHDKSLVNPVASTQSNVRNAALGTLSPGRYYWRVRLLNGNGKAVLSSPVGSFAVLPPLESTKLLKPGDGSIFNLINATTLGFTWTKVPRASYYRFTLAQAAAGSAVSPPLVSRSRVTTNRIDITTMSLFKRGSYTWSVTAYTRHTASHSAQRGPTATASFSLGTVETIPAPTLFSPGQGSKLDGLSALLDGVRFSWKGPGPGASTTMTLAGKPDLSGVVATMGKTTDSQGRATASLAQLLPGSYYWRVVGRTANGFLAPQSRTGHFTVGSLPPLAAPTALVPGDGTDVNMWGKRALGLSWSPVALTSYYLVRLLSGSTVVQSWKQTGGTHIRFTDLSKLNVGSFHWEVTAYEIDDYGVVVRKSAPAMAYFTISLRQMKSPKITSPGVVYVQ